MQIPVFSPIYIWLGIVYSSGGRDTQYNVTQPSGLQNSKTERNNNQHNGNHNSDNQYNHTQHSGIQHNDNRQHDISHNDSISRQAA
jgi:hypothetical protein